MWKIEVIVKGGEFANNTERSDFIKESKESIVCVLGTPSNPIPERKDYFWLDTSISGYCSFVILNKTYDVRARTIVYAVSPEKF